MWHETADRFAAALDDPDLPPPTELLGSQDRFDIYRNNGAVATRDALGETFGVTRQLVGDEFFNAMAGLFIRTSPPVSPVMIEYGGTFADFIDGFEPAGSLPYLADVARLEWAWHEAYNAADAVPVTIDVLAGHPAEKLEDLMFEFHPSARLLVSEWPVAAIWQAHQIDAELDRPDAAERGESVLIVRPEMDVALHRLEPTAFSLIQRLAQGETLGRALEQTNDDADFDGSACLAALFDVGAVVGVA